MRHISATKVRVKLSETWLDSAKERTEALRTYYGTLTAQGAKKNDPAWHDSLHKAVTDSAGVWQDRALRSGLSEASYGKCWYCEARVEQRADNPIDHYRPKNSVAEDKKHPGYWWLACDWHNYRFACTFCNSARRTATTSGGKQDRFPLWEERNRVCEPGPTGAEQPMLLDPMNAADPQYLSFDRSGKAAPRYGKDVNEYFHHRALDSISAYHLDRGALSSARQALMAKMEEDLLAAEEYARQLGGGNPTAESAYSRVCDALAACITAEAEFSSAARVFLGMKRATSEVAQILLETIN